MLIHIQCEKDLVHLESARLAFAAQEEQLRKDNIRLEQTSQDLQITSEKLAYSMDKVSCRCSNSNNNNIVSFYTSLYKAIVTYSM